MTVVSTHIRSTDTYYCNVSIRLQCNILTC